MIQEALEYSKPLFSFNINKEEHAQMCNYLEESYFLTESAADNLLKDTLSKLKRVCAELKSGDFDIEEVNEELYDIYETLKTIGDAKPDTSSLSWFMLIWGIIVTIVGYLVATIGAGVDNEMTITVGAISAIIGTLMATIGGLTVIGFQDKVYNFIINLESKYMMIKRKAHKNLNRKLEREADDMIKKFEDFKTKRRKEYQVYEESTSINESDKSEIKINNFRQAVDEMNRTFQNAFTKLKISADIVLKIMEKGLSINKDNKDDIVNACVDIGNGGNDEFDKEEVLNPYLSGNLLQKWSKTFSAKYSPYGMDVRDKFEAKIAKFTDEVIDYINEFFDKMNKMVGTTDKGIDIISSEFYDKVRHQSSVEAADKIDGIVGSWYNDGVKAYLNFLNNEINWAKSILQTNKIKKSLRYRILSKFVK